MAKKIGIITSGGDAPGMNAAVRAVVRYGISLGYQMVGIRRGFKGLLEDDFATLTLRSVSGIINTGGTFLHTGRCPETKTKAGMNRAVRTIKELDLSGLIIIGGDGSLAAGNALTKFGVKVVNIPASIDNDIYGTDETIGYDTALNTAVEAIDKIRDTATSHDRIFVVEIMGREHGFLTLDVGIAAGCEFIVVPEMKPNMKKLALELTKGKERGKTSEIIAFAEGYGCSDDFADEIAKLTGLEVRVSNLGYIQRGGRPTARTRILASKFGVEAMKLFHAGKYNRLVGITNGKITSAPIQSVIKREKKFNEAEFKLLRTLSV
ncbi:ATP-dependent 6-phosphofructokinase [Endomicrobium proavitum]|uniref:ATP-dependent 6-phosphofructokinase n=1 Tax=Endomicrobium proavitum TaxID=1408281 RepID=A0A0G3WJF1_9BACT|nr:ATP-dependent 6-phosphofructokinase [Endomicrobium proavitum]AKL97619.1 6-phosphofructokinase [Endomicrobium proavitum]